MPEAHVQPPSVAMVVRPDQGCLLPTGIVGIPPELALFVICAVVLLFKRCREEEGSKRPWADFVLDASKQLIGLLWANLLSAWGLIAFRGTEQGSDCGWIWACTVTDATLGVFIEYIFLTVLSSILTWMMGIQMRAYKIDLLREELDLDASLTAQQVVTAASAERGLEPLGTVAEQADRLLDEIGLGCELLEDRVADFRTGDYRDVWGRLVIRKYAKQLLMWLGCIAGMKCLVVLFLMDQFPGAFESLAEVLLVPVSWDDDLQLLVVAILTPCCMEVLQAWVTDGFLQRGGLPLSELRPCVTRQAKLVIESLSASRHFCSHCGDLQQALLRPSVAKEVVEESHCEVLPRLKATHANGVGMSPTGNASTSADEVSPVACSPGGAVAETCALEAAVDGREAPEGQHSARQQTGVPREPTPQAAVPQEEKLQEASAVQAQEQRLLGLEERLAERESEFQRKIKELEDMRSWLEEQKDQALPTSPQHSDTASSQRPPASPQLPGAPTTPEGSRKPTTLPKGVKDAERQSARPWRSMARDGVSDLSLSRTPSQQASVHNIDRKIAMLEAKIAEMQLTRGVEDAITEFQAAGDGVIQEFLSGGRGCAEIASRVPRRGNRGW